MKDTNIKYLYIKFIGLIFSAILFCVTIYLNIKDGYARDEAIYVPQYIENGLWLLLVLCIICYIFFFNFDKIRNKKISLTLSSLIYIALLVYGSTITFGWVITYNQAKNRDLQSKNIELITLEKFKEILNSKGTYIIYIGRKSCPLCEYIKPDFQEFIEKSNINILYYSTEKDRDVRYDEMIDILNLANVDSVPTTIIIENSKVLETFQGKSMVDDMIKYFQ